MKKLRLRLLTVIFLTLTLTSASAKSLWLDDFNAAKLLAAQTGKDILADFTGSDWCPPCIRMEEEVFSQPDFIQQAPKSYVLLRVDFPRKTQLPERTRLQNQALAERYPFEGVPTFVLMDAEGHAFGRSVGYLEGGPKAFLAMLADLEKQKLTLQGLQKAVDNAPDGLPKAQALDALYTQAETWGIAYQYADIPPQIQRQDKSNAGGLREKYTILGEYTYLLNSWTDHSDFQTAVTQVRALAERAKPYPELQQKILVTLGMIYLNALGDQANAKLTFLKVLSLGKTTPEALQAQSLLDQLP